MVRSLCFQTCWVEWTHLTQAIKTSSLRPPRSCTSSLSHSFVTLELKWWSQIPPSIGFFVLWQPFPVRQAWPVTLNEDIFGWFPWLLRGEKLMAAQTSPSGSLFHSYTHTHTHTFFSLSRVVEGLSCAYSSLSWNCWMYKAGDFNGDR